MSMIIKPMLAGKIVDVNKLEYPLIATPKVDGIRCLKINGQALSRTFKPIPNEYIRETLKALLPEDADGELFVDASFQKTTSSIMSMAGTPSFIFCMFDLVLGDLKTPYVERLENISLWLRGANDEQKKYIKPLQHKWINSFDELMNYETICLAEGFEGVMVRSPDSPYKCGRSTAKEGYLLKLKRFADSEAIVLGFEEMQGNQNAVEQDNFGLTKRSTCKAGMVGKNTLGKFLVKDLKTDVEFSVGTGQGLTQELRQQIWDNREAYLGQTVKYKYQAQGVKDKPRCPVWLGFRDKRDM